MYMYEEIFHVYYVERNLRMHTHAYVGVVCRHRICNSCMGYQFAKIYYITPQKLAIYILCT